jgi:hypothetical protein
VVLFSEIKAAERDLNQWKANTHKIFNGNIKKQKIGLGMWE